jgi:hypothetical protein
VGRFWPEAAIEFVGDRGVNPADVIDPATLIA